jgi:hypothetical protein
LILQLEQVILPLWALMYSLIKWELHLPPKQIFVRIKVANCGKVPSCFPDVQYMLNKCQSKSSQSLFIPAKCLW